MDFEVKDFVAAVCWMLFIGGILLWMHFDAPKTMIVLEPGSVPAICEANGYGSPECHAEMYVRLNARLDRLERMLQKGDGNVQGK